MIQKCGTDYNTETSRTNYAHGTDACGKMFDDTDHMTICPHPHLDDPTWRKQIDDYMTSKGYVWSEAESRYQAKNVGDHGTCWDCSGKGVIVQKMYRTVLAVERDCPKCKGTGRNR